MSLDRDLLRRIRRLDQYELRRLLIVIRGLLVHVDGEQTEEPGLEGVSYVQRSVRCGKDACRRCPHGPYWYARWQQDGQTKTAYIGRHLPGQEPEPVVPDMPPRNDRRST